MYQYLISFTENIRPQISLHISSHTLDRFIGRLTLNKMSPIHFEGTNIKWCGKTSTHFLNYKSHLELVQTFEHLFKRYEGHLGKLQALLQFRVSIVLFLFLYMDKYNAFILTRFNFYFVWDISKVWLFNFDIWLMMMTDISLSVQVNYLYSVILSSMPHL